jgi:hypothetical protein
MTPVMPETEAPAGVNEIISEIGNDLAQQNNPQINQSV